jgi:hypothetical protein
MSPIPAAQISRVQLPALISREPQVTLAQQKEDKLAPVTFDTRTRAQKSRGHLRYDEKVDMGGIPGAWPCVLLFYDRRAQRRQTELRLSQVVRLFHFERRSHIAVNLQDGQAFVDDQSIQKGGILPDRSSQLFVVTAGEGSHQFAGGDVNLTHFCKEGEKTPFYRLVHVRSQKHLSINGEGVANCTEFGFDADDECISNTLNSSVIVRLRAKTATGVLWVGSKSPAASEEQHDGHNRLRVVPAQPEEDLFRLQVVSHGEVAAVAQMMSFANKIMGFAVEVYESPSAILADGMRALVDDTLKTVVLALVSHVGGSDEDALTVVSTRDVDTQNLAREVGLIDALFFLLFQLSETLCSDSERTGSTTDSTGVSIVLSDAITHVHGPPFDSELAHKVGDPLLCKQNIADRRRQQLNNTIRLLYKTVYFVFRGNRQNEKYISEAKFTQEQTQKYGFEGPPKESLSINRLKNKITELKLHKRRCKDLVEELELHTFAGWMLCRIMIADSLLKDEGNMHDLSKLQAYNLESCFRLLITDNKKLLEKAVGKTSDFAARGAAEGTGSHSWLRGNMVSHLCGIILQDISPTWLQFLQCLASTRGKGVKENQAQMLMWLFPVLVGESAGTDEGESAEFSRIRIDTIVVQRPQTNASGVGGGTDHQLLISWDQRLKVFGDIHSALPKRGAGQGITQPESAELQSVYGADAVRLQDRTWIRLDELYERERGGEDNRVHELQLYYEELLLFFAELCICPEGEQALDADNICIKTLRKIFPATIFARPGGILGQNSGKNGGKHSLSFADQHYRLRRAFYILMQRLYVTCNPPDENFAKTFKTAGIIELWLTNNISGSQNMGRVSGPPSKKQRIAREENALTEIIFQCMQHMTKRKRADGDNLYQIKDILDDVQHYRLQGGESSGSLDGKPPLEIDAKAKVQYWPKIITEKGMAGQQAAGQQADVVIKENKDTLLDSMVAVMDGRNDRVGGMFEPDPQKRHEQGFSKVLGCKSDMCLVCVNFISMQIKKDVEKVTELIDKERKKQERKAAAASSEEGGSSCLRRTSEGYEYYKQTYEARYITIIILLVLISIGLTILELATESTTVTFILQTVVTLIFVAEVGIRMAFEGQRYVEDPFCLCDLLVTLVDVGSFVIEIVVLSSSTQSASVVKILRTARFAKLLKFVRIGQAHRIVGLLNIGLLPPVHALKVKATGVSAQNNCVSRSPVVAVLANRAVLGQAESDDKTGANTSENPQPRSLDDKAMERVLDAYELDEYELHAGERLDLEKKTKSTDLFFVLTDLMMYQNAELFETSFTTLLELYLPRSHPGWRENEASEDLSQFRAQRRWRNGASVDYDLLVRRFLYLDQPQVLKALVPEKLLRQKNLNLTRVVISVVEVNTEMEQDVGAQAGVRAPFTLPIENGLSEEALEAKLRSEITKKWSIPRERQQLKVWKTKPLKKKSGLSVSHGCWPTKRNKIAQEGQLPREYAQVDPGEEGGKGRGPPSPNSQIKKLQHEQKSVVYRISIDQQLDPLLRRAIDCLRMSCRGKAALEFWYQAGCPNVNTKMATAALPSALLQALEARTIEGVLKLLGRIIDIDTEADPRNTEAGAGSSGGDAKGLLSVMSREGRMTQFARMLEFNLNDATPTVSFTLLNDRQVLLTKYFAAEMVIDLLSTKSISEPVKGGSPVRTKLLEDVLLFGRRLLQQRNKKAQDAMFNYCKKATRNMHIWKYLHDHIQAEVAKTKLALKQRQERVGGRGRASLSLQTLTSGVQPTGGPCPQHDCRSLDCRNYHTEPSSFSISAILDFLRLLMEGHNDMMQSALRNQDVAFGDNDTFDLLMATVELLRYASKEFILRTQDTDPTYKDDPADEQMYRDLIQMFGVVVEACQGGSDSARQNQLDFAKSSMVESCKQIILAGMFNLPMTSADTSVVTAKGIKTKAVEALVSLIEARADHDNSIHRLLRSKIEPRMLTHRLEAVGLQYKLLLRLQKLQQDGVIDYALTRSKKGRGGADAELSLEQLHTHATQMGHEHDKAIGELSRILSELEKLQHAALGLGAMAYDGQTDPMEAKVNKVLWKQNFNQPLAVEHWEAQQLQEAGHLLMLYNAIVNLRSKAVVAGGQAATLSATSLTSDTQFSGPSLGTVLKNKICSVEVNFKVTNSDGEIWHKLVNISFVKPNICEKLGSNEQAKLLAKVDFTSDDAVGDFIRQFKQIHYQITHRHFLSSRSQLEAYFSDDTENLHGRSWLASLRIGILQMLLGLYVSAYALAGRRVETLKTWSFICACMMNGIMLLYLERRPGAFRMQLVYCSAGGEYGAETCMESGETEGGEFSKSDAAQLLMQVAGVIQLLISVTVWVFTLVNEAPLVVHQSRQTLIRRAAAAPRQLGQSNWLVQILWLLWVMFLGAFPVFFIWATIALRFGQMKLDLVGCVAIAVLFLMGISGLRSLCRYCVQDLVIYNMPLVSASTLNVFNVAYFCVSSVLGHWEVQFWSLYVTASILGLTHSRFWYSIHLLDVLLMSPTLQNVVRAVTGSIKQLGVTAVFGFFCIYIFAAVGFFYLEDEYINEGVDECGTLLRCFYTTVYYGLTAGAGIGEHLAELRGFWLGTGEPVWWFVRYVVSER